MEEEGAAGRLWVFRAIPGFLLECRFSWAGSHEGYSGVVLKTWGVKVVVTVRSSGRFPAQPRSAPPVVLHGGTTSRMS